MALGTAGSYFGIASQNTDLIPIFKENEIKKHPNSFLKTSDLILKKIAISAPSGTVFQINESDFLMPSNAFELGYNVIDVKSLIFKQDTNVTITYIY